MYHFYHHKSNSLGKPIKYEVSDIVEEPSELEETFGAKPNKPYETVNIMDNINNQLEITAKSKFFASILTF